MRDDTATVFHRSYDNTLNKCAEAEGMGSGIPIKFAGEAKSAKRVLSYAGETCSGYPEFGITLKEKKTSYNNSQKNREE